MKIAELKLISNNVSVSARRDAEGEVLSAKIAIKRAESTTEIAVHISELATLGEFLLEAAKKLSANESRLQREIDQGRAKFWEFE